MKDLFTFNNGKKKDSTVSYTAEDIEVLEGIAPVRVRPGMFIPGVDEHSMHHLVKEVLDNAMDEVVAGYATYVSVSMHDDHSITIGDNGRGIPTDFHPKFPDKSALEVVLTTLHSGGKFTNNLYKTAGGLHGVGLAVVNALSDRMEVSVYRAGKLFNQKYSKGMAVSALESKPTPKNMPKNMQGTTITFHPDAEIFGDNSILRPDKIYDLIKTKAYLHKGIKIDWKCADKLIQGSKTPNTDVIYFPGGLQDYISSKVSEENIVGKQIFTASVLAEENFKIEWALCWNNSDVSLIQSYCNTIPTSLGGTHEQGFKAGLLKSIKSYGEMISNKKAANIIVEDILDSALIILSVFINNPLFQGQTKDKLVNANIIKIIENTVKDYFDHWLSNDKTAANEILEFIIASANARIARKNDRSTLRKNVIQKLRLPGKLIDCSREQTEGTELFIVEGDSAGGSAKQARDRETQAILPIRGKILNIASAGLEKMAQNQEIKDLEIALAYNANDKELKNLRYEKVIIMTDADVDGAHIASLLMTFFYLRMPQLILKGHLYIACAPLYRIIQGDKSYYAINEEERDALIKKLSTKSRVKIDVSRFKGLGEMNASQLKETTMDPKKRLLLKVTIENLENVTKMVSDLMGKKPEKRLEFIQTQAFNRMNDIINNLDI